MIWNPFDWTAGPFLALYFIVAVIVFLQGFRLKSKLGPAVLVPYQLKALELAYLAGGAHRLGDAVLFSLVTANAATIASKGDEITVIDQTPLTALVGQPILLSVQPSMTRRQFQAAIQPIVEQVQGRLQELGYCPTDDQMASFRMNVLPCVALLFVFGMLKVFIGSDRGHPVGILVSLLILTVFGGIVLAGRRMLTSAGEDALRTYRASHARASRAPLDRELLFALALSGPIILSGTAYASVYAASQTMSGGGGVSASDGGSGCSSGGSGCGGCGGGGGGS